MVLHTLQIEHACLLLVYTLLTLGNARLQKGMRGVKLFVLYNGLALLGAVAVVLRGDIPDFLSIVVGNLCVMAGYTALYCSMHSLFGFARRQHFLAGACLVFGLLTMIWLGAIHPDTRVRLLFYSLVLASQQLQLGWLLFLGPLARRRVSWMLGLFLGGMVVVNVTRMYTVLAHGAPSDYRLAGPALAAAVLANACLQCGLMVSYVWMTAAQLRRDLEVLAHTDPLTGILNRRALELQANQLLRSSRAGAVSSVLQLDLDNFKPINDCLGHGAGDQALVAVARLLRQEFRAEDLVARTGGDEFVAFLPHTTAEQALSLAERLRTSLEQLDLGLAGLSRHVTGSFGVAEAIEGETWDELCLRSDRALYAVKAQGGNGVLCFQSVQSLSVDALFLEVP